jgi:tetratricopeptide (TPR) repeat protein
VARNDGRYDVALEEIRAAAVLDPGEPRIRRRLVELYVKAGNLEDALTQAIALRGLEPSEPANILVIGNLLSALGRTDEAIAAYDEVLAAEPTNVEILVKLGSLYTKQQVRQKRGASPRCRGAADSFIVRPISAARTRRRNYDAALTAYRTAADLNPSADQIYLRWGSSTSSAAGATKRSNPTRALEINPQSLLARRQLGGVYVAGRLEDALKEYEQLVTLEEDPLDTQTKVALVVWRRATSAGGDEFSVIRRVPTITTCAFTSQLRTTRYDTEEAQASPEFRRFRPLSTRTFTSRNCCSGVRRRSHRGSQSPRERPRFCAALHRRAVRSGGKFDRALATARRLVELEPARRILVSTCLGSREERAR